MSAGYKSVCAAILTLTLGATSVDIATASTPVPNRGHPAPSGCPVIYQKDLIKQGTLVHYDLGAECGRTGSDGRYAGRPHLERIIHTDGTACQIQYDASVTFQDFTGYISASWSSPTGVGNELHLWPYSNGPAVSTAAIKASNSSVYAVYARNGTYQNNDCQPQSGWKSLCWEGRGTEDPCTYTEPYSITRANSPPPSIAPYIAQVMAEVKAQAGTINSLPNPKGLVNLPTCFWLDNIGVPDEQDYALVLAGPPDRSGRQIFYTYLIRLFFGGVDWNFDDPLGNAETAPHPACGQHPQLTAPNDRDALTSGAFADPGLFAYDLQDLDKAKQSGGTLLVQGERTPTVQLVKIPPDLQDSMRRQGMQPQPYGLAVEFAGPGAWTVRLQNGQSITIDSVDSPFLGTLLIWGEFLVDPDLGTIRMSQGCTVVKVLSEVSVAIKYARSKSFADH